MPETLKGYQEVESCAVCDGMGWEVTRTVTLGQLSRNTTILGVDRTYYYLQIPCGHCKGRLGPPGPPAIVVMNWALQVEFLWPAERPGFSVRGQRGRVYSDVLSGEIIASASS